MQSHEDHPKVSLTDILIELANRLDNLNYANDLNFDFETDTVSNVQAELEAYVIEEEE